MVVPAHPEKPRQPVGDDLDLHPPLGRGHKRRHHVLAAVVVVEVKGRKDNPLFGPLDQPQPVDKGVPVVLDQHHPVVCHLPLFPVEAGGGGDGGQVGDRRVMGRYDQRPDDYPEQHRPDPGPDNDAPSFDPQGGGRPSCCFQNKTSRPTHVGYAFQIRRWVYYTTAPNPISPIFCDHLPTGRRRQTGGFRGQFCVKITKMARPPQCGKISLARRAGNVIE